MLYDRFAIYRKKTEKFKLDDEGHPNGLDDAYILRI